MRPSAHGPAMTLPRPYVLTVFDPTEGRLLRIQELPDEDTLALLEMEERDHYARHPFVEVQAYWGRSVEEVRRAYERRPDGRPGAGA